MVRNRPRWAPGSNQYVKRVGANRPGAPEGPGTSEAAVTLGTGSDYPTAEAVDVVDADAQMRDTGITWGSVDVSPIAESDVERARHRFRASLPNLVWNAARLEGNTFTLPEVRTLLDGVTVGGRPSDDAAQILALSQAYRDLDQMVGDGAFTLDKATSDHLHAIVAQHEALDAGRFRGEGTASGGGTVNLSNGGQVPGTPHGEGGVLLRERFTSLIEHLDETTDPRLRAVVYFAAATRAQFYFDGNKRTARLMMTGVLMTNGYDAINIPYARRLEFNHALDHLFTTDDGTELMNFLATCAGPS